MLRVKYIIFFFFFFYQINCFALDLLAGVSAITFRNRVSASSPPDGEFVEIIKAIDGQYKDGKIKIEYFPFSRSLDNIQKGVIDFHIPLIKPPYINHDTLPFVYSSEAILPVTLVLYTKSDLKELDLAKMAKYKIGTQRGHSNLFKFKVSEAKDIRQGIEQLLRGRIDGFIMVQEAVDKYIRTLKIPNIRRTKFASWPSHIIIPRGDKHKKIDTIISTALRALKKTSQFQSLLSKIHKPYDNWQPYLSN